MSDVSKEVLAMAKLLETQGWCQGREKDGKGRYCLYGAFKCIAPNSSNWQRVNYWFVANKGMNPIAWNDRPGASKIRVIQALRACARDLA